MKRSLFKKKLIWLCSFAFLLPMLVQAKIVISGKVIDAQTQEAIPFANVYLQGDPSISTTSDFDGVYMIELEEAKQGDRLESSVMGYTSVSKLLTTAKEQTLNFALQRTEYVIETVKINSGINPAIRILKNIIKHKPHHNKKKIQTYQYELYNKLEIDIDGISEKLQDKKIFNQIDFIFDYMDSTSEDKPFLPVFISEKVSDIYYRKRPTAHREIIKAKKASGFDNPAFSDFVSSLYQEISIYDNQIEIFDKFFISPIASNGLAFYTYFILDTTQINGRPCFQLQFSPKVKGNQGLAGDLWVDTLSWGVLQISMHTDKNVDINYVEEIHIFQSYQYIEDKVLMPLKDKLVINFIKTKNNPGLIGRRNLYYKDVRINTDLDSILRKKQPVFKHADAEDKTEVYWTKNRHDTLSRNEVGIYKMIDSVKSVPLVKKLIYVGKVLTTGYIPLGPVEFGKIHNILGVNTVEKVRLQMGLRTTDKFSQHVRMTGYLGYGIRDKALKYGAKIEAVWRPQSRNKVEIGYRDDLVRSSNFNDNFGGNNLFSSLLRRPERRLVSLGKDTFLQRQIPNKLIYIREGILSYEKEWVNGFVSTLSAVHRELRPTRIFDFRYIHPVTLDTLSTFKTSEISFINTFSFSKKKFVRNTFDRRMYDGNLPILFLKYTAGIKGLLNSQFDYHKISLDIRYKFPINPIGTTKLGFSIGKTFGNVPFFLTQVLRGNDGIFFQPYGFNLLQQFEYAGDFYGNLFFNQHFEGLFFNKIPGIRKLKLRSVFHARFMMSRFSLANRESNRLNLASNCNESENCLNPVLIKTANRFPYVELGFGIENILTIFRLDFVWRVTHRSSNQSNFGVFLGAEFSL